MRIDCDEDIFSGKNLFSLYNKKSIPFSMAVKTSLNPGADEISFIHDVLKNNGALLSHTVNHLMNWGEDYSTALEEGLQSKTFLDGISSEKPVRYAVSPFHSNPEYAVRALEDAGYHGFISGIIRNDPEYLTARGGRVPFADRIISHSQQCMLHGDCLLKDDMDPLRIYKEAFEFRLSSQTFFGYLDHPFSDRYDYGWGSKERRLQAHDDYIDFILSHENIAFMNEEQCLDFMMKKNALRYTMDKRNSLHHL